MSKKLCVFAILLLSSFHLCFAQTGKQTAILKGKLFNSNTKAPFSDLKISIPGLNVFTTSDGEGNFMISEIPYGKQTLIISHYNAVSDTISVVVNSGVVDLHDIRIKPTDKGITAESNEIPTITIEGNSSSNAEDDGVSSVSGGGILSTNGDPFLIGVGGIFSLYNFHFRGYQNNPQNVIINGITINDIETENAHWTQNGRLYDVFSNRDGIYGLGPSPYSFGGKNGTTNIRATAADQPAEMKVSYTLTDRYSSNGLMLTANSGPKKNGWAYSFSFAKRFAKEGYAPGTFYNDYSYYAAVSKVIKKGTLNLTTFGSLVDRGKSAAATQEAYDLAGSNYYNQDWGYYDGQKRNARVEKLFRPITILNYEYKPSDKTRWNTSAGYEFGKDKNSFIDYYNASSPYGDYYRNMPSYYSTMVPPDTAAANAIRKQIQSDPSLLQINWDRMYQDNYTNLQTMTNVNGVAGNNYTGKQSEYVLSNYVNDMKKFTFNTNIEHILNENTTLYGGFTLISQQNELYKQIVDLLGGDYFVNFNQFASQQYVGNPNYIQNNLNDPNAVIRTGDKYGYDYTLRYNNSSLWGQLKYTYDKLDFFAAATGGDNSFSREGFMRNGLFPDNSYGSSPTQNFLTYAIKGGVNYKVDSRNNFFLNASYSVTPPTADNTYISAATRDFTVSNPTTQKNTSLEGGYLLRSSKINARVLGYLNNVKDATEIKRFFNDDPAYYTFVNYVMQGENTQSVGTELALEYKLLRQLSVLGLASVGRAIYTNRPTINVYLDNDTSEKANPSTAYIKDYFIASGPQSTYILGFNYHPRRDLYVNLNFNYFDRNYVEINPNRRTQAASGVYPAGSPQWDAIYNQEELPSTFTVDLRAGKKFLLSRMYKPIDNLSHNTTLTISASISNLLNNTNVINSGYEQLRYDFVNYNPDKFANKYVYGMGINFSLNASLKF